MVCELLSMYLPLNRLLAKALSVQVVEGSPQKRDDVLLETKVALSDVLERFCKDPRVQSLLHIQRELCRILLMNTDLEAMNVVLRVNTLVSKGLENLPDLENMPMEIFEFMTTVVIQEEIRHKILSFLCVASKFLGDFEKNVYLEHLFKLDQELSKILAEEEEDKKLDGICGLTFLLTEFMVTDYPDDNTEWIVQLNHLASRAMVEKFEDQKHLVRANNILSQAMRKLADKPYFRVIIELNCILSSVLLLDGATPKYNQLIGWKLLLTVVMQEIIADENARCFKKSAQESDGDEEDLERLNARIALVSQEMNEFRAKAMEMRTVIAELARERTQLKKEIREIFVENIALNSEIRAMKEGQKQDETVDEMENILVLLDVLEETVPEGDPNKLVARERLKESEKKFEPKEILNKSSEKPVEVENLTKSEEKPEEKPVQPQLLNEEMKDEDKNGKKSESTAKEEGATEVTVAGVVVGANNAAKEMAGPSDVQGKGQIKHKNSKKKGKGSAGKSSVDKDPGPGSSRGQRSKKK